MRGRTLITTLLPAATALIVVACSGASPATTSPASEATQPAESNMPGFVLRSPSFTGDGSIPRKYSCDGENVSPALEWEGAPDATLYFALIVDDPDARGFVHWVVYNMTGSATGLLPEAVSASPDAPSQGRNGFGQVGYGGPCPPSGTHHYTFTLYALSGPLQLTGAPSASDVQQAISGVLLGKTTLTGTYARQR